MLRPVKPLQMQLELALGGRCCLSGAHKFQFVLIEKGRCVSCEFHIWKYEFHILFCEFHKCCCEFHIHFNCENYILLCEFHM